MTTATALDIPPFLDTIDTPLPCRQDPEAFFPAKDAEGVAADPARRICRACPVFWDCRTYGLKHPDLFGIWGGLSRRQRRFKARAAARPPAGRTGVRADTETPGALPGAPGAAGGPR